MSFDPETLPYRRNVGVMVLNRAGHVWIGRRIPAGVWRNPADAAKAGGWWQMPQGGIDDGEEPAAAALRELTEETGMRSAAILAESAQWHSYDLPADLMGRALGGRFRGQTQKWFLLRFTGDDGEINIAPTDHEAEFDAWRWAQLHELEPLIVPFKRPVYQTILAEFGDRVKAG
jgi:putative (di)nucleoside polyphosphate hydrolase